MPGLIQKSAYIPSGKAGGYMNYIATREGVELLRENGYLNYIAHRPGVEKQGSHGLFGSRDGVALSTAQAELSENQGPVWTLIFSLRREDAARLGYDRAETWKQLLRAHQAELAEAMKIPPASLRWYAAFHDAGHHPHVHMMVWSDDPKHVFLTTEGIESMRSKLTNSIFKDELTALYVQKDLRYREVRDAAEAGMRACLQRMDSAAWESKEVERLMQDLARQLRTVSGKKQYGYLKKDLKQLVDRVVDELEKQPDVRQFYGEWNALRDRLEGYYKDSPREHLPLSRQKEFRAIKNLVIREALRLNLEQQEEGNSPAPPEPGPALASCTLRLLHHLSRVFRENAIAPANPQGIRIDSRRRKKLMEKRLALGHKPNDHEQQVQV